MVGHQSPVGLDRKQVHDRKRRRENRKDAGVAHRPNKPLTLFNTWPTRKLYQTMKQSSAVMAARAAASLASSGVRQTSQERGSIPSPIGTHCSWTSKVPWMVQSWALS